MSNSTHMFPWHACFLLEMWSGQKAKADGCTTANSNVFHTLSKTTEDVAANLNILKKKYKSIYTTCIHTENFCTSDSPWKRIYRYMNGNFNFALLLAFLHHWYFGFHIDPRHAIAPPINRWQCSVCDAEGGEWWQQKQHRPLWRGRLL